MAELDELKKLNATLKKMETYQIAGLQLQKQMLMEIKQMRRIQSQLLMAEPGQLTLETSNPKIK